MTESVRILVVEDDPAVRELLDDYLSDQGFEVQTAERADSAREHLENATPAVVLLDIGLPGEDGLSLARYIRERFDIGIIMISGAGDTIDRIVGLEVGADDYIAKPFDPRELKARLKSVLRRYQHSPIPPPATAVPENAVPTGNEDRRLQVGNCILDLDSHQLFDREGAEIQLTRMEFDLLEVLVQRPRRPLSRDQLLNLTQNRDWDPYDRSIDIRIARLRRKIEADPENPQCIRTMRGLGYMFVPT